MIQKFIFATLNIDAALLKDSDSNKEQNLIYTSFIRLSLSALVVFGITLFACYNVPALANPYGGLYAWLVATFVAMIVFWLDSAIIGSEWEKPQTNQTGLLQTYVDPSIFDELKSFGFKFTRLLPRIAFSITVAFFIATIAELALQKEAIQTVLTDEAIAFNDEKGNTKRREEKVATLDSEIKGLKEQKKAFEENIKAHDIGNPKTLESDKTNLTESKGQIEELLGFLKTIKGSKIAMAEETAPNTPKCRASETGNIEKCKGTRYRAAFDAQLVAESELRERKYAVDSERIDAQIQEQQNELDRVVAQLDNIDAEQAKVSNRTRPQLEEALVNIDKAIKKAEDDKVIKMDAFDKDEIKNGKFRDPYDYDFLLLYSGLKTLHKDPVKGDAAKFFSYMLFVFIMLMELSSVITALFFAPYSIYASKSYAKIRKRQLEEDAEIYKYKRKREMEILSKSDWENTMDNAMNQDRRSDNPNPTPPPQKE